MKVDRNKNNKYSKLLKKFKEDDLKMTAYNLNDFLSEFKGSDKKFLYSAKVDGESNILVYEKGKAKLYSREGFIRYDLPLTIDVEKKLKKRGIKRLIVIGDVYARDDKLPFKPFRITESYLKKPESKKEEDLLSFVVYGILKVDNQKVDNLDKLQRVKIIKKVLPKDKYIHPAKFVIGPPEKVKELWNKWVKKQKYEGLVIYVDGKEDKIIKIKPVFDYDLGVIAAQEGTGKYKGTLGALWVGFMDKDKNIRLAANVGTGFTDEERNKLWEIVNKNKVEGPIKMVPVGKKKTRLIWTKPKIVVRIGAHEVNIRDAEAFKYEKGKWIDVGKLKVPYLREPRYLGLREDKAFDPIELRLEQVPEWKKSKKIKKANIVIGQNIGTKLLFLGTKAYIKGENKNHKYNSILL